MQHTSTWLQGSQTAGRSHLNAASAKQECKHAKSAHLHLALLLQRNAALAEDSSLPAAVRKDMGCVCCTAQGSRWQQRQMARHTGSAGLGAHSAASFSEEHKCWETPTWGWTDCSEPLLLAFRGWNLKEKDCWVSAVMPSIKIAGKAPCTLVTNCLNICLNVPCPTPLLSHFIHEQ